MNNENLFKIVDEKTLEVAPETISTGAINIANPSLAVYHKFGYWPKEQVEPRRPDDEQGYVVYDDGYKYIDDGNGGKIIKRIYRKLQVVDPGMPQLRDNQVFKRSYWEETATERRKVYVILTEIDIPPTIDRETQILLGSEWVEDEEARTRTHVYQVRTKVDNPPELGENQQIIKDYWEDDGRQFYTHVYEVRTIVDNPPTLNEGEQVVEEHWEDDGVTKTHVYDKVMKVIDNEPTLEEGQQIVDRWFEDDEETNTRTYQYAVRVVVDNPPELAENEYIVNEYWDDDGTTRTHIYETHFRVDNPPVLEEGQQIVEDHWDYIEETRTEMHVYTVRKVVDEGAPELSENEFIKSDYWEDDGETRTHIYEVWTRVDVPPTATADQRVYATDEWTDDPVAKTTTRVYIIKTVVDEKPADDPDGNFWWEFDGEDESADQVIKRYKQVFKQWRIFSKLKLEMVIFQLGKMKAFDAYLNTTQMTNAAGETATLRRFYDQANELLENHKLFKPYFNEALQALGLTTEQGEALLAQCVKDE